MPGIKAITVSVGYGDALAITWARNMRHFTESVVVSSPEDTRTHEVARSIPGTRLSITDAFTRHGARFNKGLALEEAGFDVLGCEGWVAIVDADILLPDSLPLASLDPAKLHGCKRRILENPGAWHPGLDWSKLPIAMDGSSPIGYTQIFNAHSPFLRDKRPWYDVSFAHGGGGDAYFMCHWPREKLEVLDVDVLHLGVPDQHWFGTDREGKDMMAAFVHRNGWGRAMRKSDPTAVHRVGPIVERVQVPGYAPSNYELPFVRRAQEQRGRRP